MTVVLDWHYSRVTVDGVTVFLKWCYSSVTVVFGVGGSSHGQTIKLHVVLESNCFGVADYR
jgi:hypothetical protein